MNCKDAIVVMDSGIGGISLLYACHKIMPYEDLTFYGDCAFAPYGDKSKEQVANRVLDLASTFFSNGAKALALACNTATSAAADLLRKTWPEKIIVGLEPALKPAVAQYPNKQIFVLATALTIQEEKFQKLFAPYQEKKNILPLPCPGLMNLMEEEAPFSAVAAYLEEKIAPLVQTIDPVFVLGCTHYIFLPPTLKKLWPQCHLIHGNIAAAQYLANRLAEQNMCSKEKKEGTIAYYASAKEVEFQQKCQRFWYRMKEE